MSGELGAVLVVLVFLICAGLLLLFTRVGDLLLRQVRGRSAAVAVSVPATVVERRTGEHGGYYVTFDLDGVGRQTFTIWGEEFDSLEEGDRGMLTHRGESYQRFVPDLSQEAQ